MKGYPHLRSRTSYRKGTRAVAVHPEMRKRFTAHVEKIARIYKLDPGLIDAVISVESAYDPVAVSSDGALGLMQLMPDTARRFDVSDPLDPVANIHGGARYLRWLMDRFDNDLDLVLAAYNAGEGALEEHGNRIPPYPETRTYVARVRTLYEAKPAAH
jgi:soluble lytic murein transglycosylase-like protein